MGIVVGYVVVKVGDGQYHAALGNGMGFIVFGSAELALVAGAIQDGRDQEET